MAIREPGRIGAGYGPIVPVAVARHQAATDTDWQVAYRRWRPPVERAVAWLVRHGSRRLRDRGTLANDTWLHTRAAALNLRRLINLGLTRTSGNWTINPDHRITEEGRPAYGRTAPHPGLREPSSTGR